MNITVLVVNLEPASLSVQDRLLLAQALSNTIRSVRDKKFSRNSLIDYLIPTFFPDRVTDLSDNQENINPQSVSGKTGTSDENGDLAIQGLAGYDFEQTIQLPCQDDAILKQTIGQITQFITKSQFDQDLQVFQE